MPNKNKEDNRKPTAKKIRIKTILLKASLLTSKIPKSTSIYIRGREHVGVDTARAREERREPNYGSRV